MDIFKRGKKIDRKRAIKIITVLCTVLFIVKVLMVYSQPPECEMVAFTTFSESLEKGEVEKVYIDSNKRKVRYTLLDDRTRDLSLEEREEIPLSEKKFYITDYPFNNLEFSKLVLDSGAQLEVNSFGSNIWSTILAVLLNILPLVIFLGLVLRLANKQISGNGGIIAQKRDTKVTFKDIVGHDEALHDIQQALKLMVNAEKYQDLNVTAPKGILLIGPPGTGKTMIAEAIANEAKMSFFPVDSSAMIDRFVGLGAKNIRDTFAKARSNQPAIVFFDEIDAIGALRGSTLSTSEHQQTLNALLQELDGFKPNEQVYIMAATNRFESLDPALVRSGRFDRKITINPPRDTKVRVKLLQHYLDGVLDETLNLDIIARQTSGFSGADIKNICNEAKMMVILNDEKTVKQEYLEEAIDKVMFNGNRTKNEYKKDLEIAAYHESGHALSMLLSDMPIARISVIPNTSGVGGMVIRQEDSESLMTTKRTLINQIKSLYCGRIAEELIFGADGVTIGASNDLSMADKILDRYLFEFAFDKDYGLVKLDDRTHAEKKSELANSLYREAYKELENNIDILKKIAEEVLKKETIDGVELKEMYERFKASVV